MFIKPKYNFLKFILFFISLLGFLFILLEIIFNFKGQSLCKTEGCQIVHIFDVYNILNWIGLIFFVYLLFTSIIDISNIFFINFFLNLRVFLISLAIIVEGYFLTIQTWFLGKFCQYCLIIAFLFLLFMIIDYLYQKNFNKFSYLYTLSLFGSIAIFITGFIVNIPLKPIKLDSKPLIIYEKGCNHCREVINYTKNHKIDINVYEIKKFWSALRIFNINSVPVLIYQSNNKITLIIGKNDIIQWFKHHYESKTDLTSFLSTQTNGVCSILNQSCE